MAYKRKILEEAAREYREIVSYLATVLCSPDAARGFMDEFEHQLDLVCDMPELYGLSRMKELAVLGYRGSEVAAALKGIDMDALPLEEIIRQALKRMVK